MSQNRKKYFTFWRFGLLVLWVLALVLLPELLISQGYLPEGAWFVPVLLICPFVLAILLDTLALRISLTVVVVIATVHLYTPESVGMMLDGLNFKMRDTFFKIRGPRKPTGQVIVIDLDKKTMEEMGQPPLPRTEVARMITNAMEDGARVMGFDIIFPEPDRTSVKDWAYRLQQTGMALLLPGVSIEHSKELIAKKFWGFDIPRTVVEADVLADWEDFLIKENPLFYVDPALEPQERRRVIEAAYVEYDRALFERNEESFAKRMQDAGLDYVKKSYLEASDVMAQMIERSPDVYYISKKLGAPFSLITDNDLALGEAFAQGRAVAGAMMVMSRSAGAKHERKIEEFGFQEKPGALLSSAVANTEEHFPILRRGIEQVLNVPEIQQMAYHQGFFNIVPDPSGAARFYTMMLRGPVYQKTMTLKEEFANAQGPALLDPQNYEEKISSQYVTYPSLVLEMLRAANGYDVTEAAVRNGQEGLVLRREKGFSYEGIDTSTYYTQETFSKLLPAERFIPLDFKGDLQIDFHGFGGPWEPEYLDEKEYYFKYISMSDVLFKRFEKGFFKDSYVLFGSTDPTLSDLVGSPFRAAFPGLEVHAVMLDNLLTQDYLIDYGYTAVLYSFLGVLIGGTILALLVAYTGPWLAGALTLAVLIALPSLSYWGLAHGKVLIDFIYPWLSTIVISGVAILVNFFIEGREKRFVAAQFSTMVSKDVLAKMQEDPSSVALGGQRAEVSIFFSDLAGFTSISEKMSPRDLVMVLNDYFTPMCNIILESKGFIDKLMGDAIMAVWGVPFADKEHAKRACWAALDQQKALLAVAKRIKDQYGVDVSARMGIGTGEVSAAMMGSESRKNYTVMGDVVNLSARLEPAAKDYSVKILISEATFHAAKDFIEARCVDKIVVKGKTVPVPIYELMAKKGELDERGRAKIKKFEEALHLHWERHFDQAQKILEYILENDPTDGPSLNLKKRLDFYREHAPPADWKGEWVKTSK